MTFDQPDRAEGCPFCAIAGSRDTSVEFVAKGPDWLAFFPLNPATPGHTLIIPRQHVEDLWKLQPEDGAGLMTAAIKVGRAIESGLHPDGMNLISSAGETAEQTVFHLHLHLVPRWHADGFGRIWPRGHRYENSELGSVADRIREAYTTDY